VYYIVSFKARFVNRFFVFLQTFVIRAAYSGREEFGKQWQKTVGEYFGGIEIGLDPLPISISCHVGPDALGISISKIK